MPYKDPADRQAYVRRYQVKNRDRVNLYSKLYRRRPEYRTKKRNYQLKNRYGITMAVYAVMWEAQNGRCEICGVWKALDSGTDSLHVDHSHRTKEVRGLL